MPLIDIGLESEATAFDFEEDDMTTVLLEKPFTEAAPQNGTAAATEEFFPIEAIAQNLTSLTNLPVDRLINIILSTRPLMQWQEGAIKIPASAAGPAFRQWAAEIEQKLTQGEMPQQLTLEAISSATAEGIAPAPVTGTPPTSKPSKAAPKAKATATTSNKLAAKKKTVKKSARKTGQTA